MEHNDYNPIITKKSTPFFTFIEKIISPFKKTFSFFRRSRILPLVIVLLFVAGLAFYGIQQAISNTNNGQVLEQTDEQTELSEPRVQKNVNKTFSFPLRDQQGQEVSQLRYTIESIELRDDVIVQGQRATAINGRTFLIINIKLTNTHNQAIQVNVRDYLRIRVGNASEQLAPDMHSDPVEVQAISTKQTRLGMAISETDKNIVLQIGEISGEKETIQLSL